MISRPYDMITQQNREVVVEVIDNNFRQVDMQAREALTLKHKYLLVCFIMARILPNAVLIYIVWETLHWYKDALS